jgi:outer membrane lipoprotein SlyB
MSFPLETRFSAREDECDAGHVSSSYTASIEPPHLRITVFATQPGIERQLFRKLSLVGLSAGMLTACAPDYSANTYASNAAQQAAKVDQAVIVGVRAVMISADPTLGTTTGGAIGGIAGSDVGTGTVSALTALGGTVAGGIAGNVASHATADTTGIEYIVRKTSGDLLSVTQKDAVPMPIGQHVLVIQGPQARIVPDYTVTIVDESHKPADAKPAPADAKPKAPAAGAGDAVAPVAAAPAPAPASSPAAEPPAAPAAEALPPPKAETPPPASTEPAPAEVKPATTTDGTANSTN